MAIRQWTDKEWENLEINLEEANTKQFQDILLDLTRTQEEHPEWYESPCLCQLCCSYGD